MSETFDVKPMAWLRTDFKQKFGTPRQGALTKSSRAHVDLAPEWRGRGIFTGLEGFSHVWIISFLHLSGQPRMRGKVHPPRLKGQKMGILGSRSPHRPNNIGLTLAKIVNCAGDELHLAEIDLVDGTPVLDLKPYLASADRPEAFTSGWTDQIKVQPAICEFSEKAQEDLERLSTEPTRLRSLILEMLKQDPRPPAYLGRTDAKFAVWVSGLNVIFRYMQDKFVVTEIEQA